MKLASDGYEQPESLLLLGPPGTGKSTLLSQIPGVFILDLDLNLGGPIRWLKENDKPLQFKYDNPFKDDEGQPIERKDWYRRAAYLLGEATKDKEVTTLGIDSLTSFVDLILVEVLRQQGRKLGEFDAIKGVKKAADEQMQIQDWGVFFNMVKQIVSRLKASGKRLVITGHIKTTEDGLTKAIQQCIAIPGQASDVLAGWFAEVWLLDNVVERKGGSTTETRKIMTFPQNAMQKSLGLKSAIGIQSGTAVNPEEIISRLCQTK